VRSFREQCRRRGHTRPARDRQSLHPAAPTPATSRGELHDRKPLRHAHPLAAALFVAPFAALSASWFLHECGHLFVACWSSVKVEVFSVAWLFGGANDLRQLFEL
jgi:hypothetical protein